MLSSVSSGFSNLTSEVALPSDFPELVLNTAGSPEDGNYFLGSLTASDATSSSYLIIVDNDAQPLFYWHWTKGIFCVKIQPNNLLSFGTRLPGNTISWLVMDSTYAFIDTFTVNDYTTDIHDFTMLENGHSLLMGVESRTVDMSLVVPGGNPNATVLGLLIQEQDEDHNTVFEWTSFDHFEVTDATYLVDLTAATIDYVHCNSLSADADGNILVSCLAMNQCVKIDRSTGDVIWRLGGVDADSSSFTIVGDPLGGFSAHHDFQSSGNGLYTLFDNGKTHNPQISRGLEYQLDTNDMTATLVWSYQETGLFGTHLGSVQRIPGGNYVIGWGDLEGTNTFSDLTEVNPDGTEEHSMRFVDTIMESYRAYKYQWEGQAVVPYLIAEVDIVNSTAILTYNVFGDNQYDMYRIWQSTDPTQLTPLLLTPERQASIWALPTGWNYFAVSAIDSDSEETELSNIDSVFVDWTGINIESNDTPLTGIVYPNPASSFVNVQLNTIEQEPIRIDFFDISGRIAMTHHETGELSTAELPAGVYTVHASSEWGNFTQNIVILR